MTKDYRQLRYYWRERIKDKFNVDPSMDLDNAELKKLYYELKEKHSKVINKPPKHNYEQLSLPETESNQTHTVDSPSTDPDSNPNVDNSPSGVENFYNALKKKHNLSDKALRDISQGISLLLYGKQELSKNPVYMGLTEYINLLLKKKEEEKEKENNGWLRIIT
jgi:hypothetical protein